MVDGTWSTLFLFLIFSFVTPVVISGQNNFSLELVLGIGVKFTPAGLSVCLYGLQ